MLGAKRVLEIAAYGEPAPNVGIGGFELLVKVVGNGPPIPPGNTETNCKGVASLFCIAT